MDSLSKIFSDDRKLFLDPLNFFAIAVLAGTRRAIRYFPSGAKGVFLAQAVLASAASFYYESKGESLSKKVTSIFASVMAIALISGTFRGRVVSSIADGLKLSVLFACFTAFRSTTLKCRDVSKAEDPTDEEKETLKAFYDNQLAVEALEDLQGSKDGMTFKSRGHEHAKKMCKEWWKSEGLAFDFVSPPQDWDDQSSDLSNLDKKIFLPSLSFGVQDEITKASSDSNAVHLFSVSSTYSGGQILHPGIPPIGAAAVIAGGDCSIGILAQRMNDAQFEWINALLPNLGFNMLESVLPSAGKTDNFASAIAHGHLKLSNANIELFHPEMKGNLKEMELPCYESKIAKDTESFYLVLGAAPDHPSSEVLASPLYCPFQFNAYLATFLAQLNQVKTLLKRHQEKKVIFHVTDLTLGVDSRSKEESIRIAAAFSKAAHWFQNNLSEKDKESVQVRIDCRHTKEDFQTYACEQLLGLGKPSIII